MNTLTKLPLKEASFKQKTSFKALKLSKRRINEKAYKKGRAKIKVKSFKKLRSQINKFNKIEDVIFKKGEYWLISQKEDIIKEKGE